MKNTSFQVVTGIIPARFASTRFPGKPLALIGGKTMIERVYEQALKSLESVFVATDDERIYNAVLNFGGSAVMTSDKHQSGTDRCAEAVRTIEKLAGRKTDIVINIQGDEPFIKPEQITQLVSCFSDRSVEIATLVKKIEPGENLFNPNHVKVVVDMKGDALYFSRSAIPYIRDAGENEWISKHVFFRHIGLYAYKTDVLEKITQLPRSPLETAESLEQNRWLENGLRIRTAVTESDTFSIDTPEDLQKAEELFGEFS